MVMLQYSRPTEANHRELKTKTKGYIGKSDSFLSPAMDDDFIGQGKIKLLHRTDAGTLPLLHYLKSDNAPFLEQDSQSVDCQILKKFDSMKSHLPRNGHAANQLTRLYSSF